MHKRRTLFIGMMILTVTACVAFLAWDRRQQDILRTRNTSPLPRETISTLCRNFALAEQDSLCNGSRDVYAVDFYEVLRQHFRPEDEFGTKGSNAATFETVEELLGKFRWECEAATYLPQSGYSYYRCLYDLRGDRHYTYAFYFYYPDNILFSLRAATADEAGD